MSPTNVDRDEAMDALKNLPAETVINFWNDYCDEGACNDHIHPNDTEVLDELFSSPSDAVYATAHGEYRTGDSYICLDGYDNLQSFSDMTDDNSPVDFDALLDWMQSYLDTEECATVLGLNLDAEDDEEEA